MSVTEAARSPFDALEDTKATQAAAKKALRDKLVGMVKDVIVEKAAAFNNSDQAKGYTTAEGYRHVRWTVSFVPGKSDAWTLSLLENGVESAVQGTVPYDNGYEQVTETQQSSIDILFRDELGYQMTPGVMLEDNYNLKIRDHGRDGRFMMAEQTLFAWGDIYKSQAAFDAVLTAIGDKIGAFMTQMEDLAAKPPVAPEAIPALKP